jgi:hypothetical protein
MGTRGRGEGGKAGAWRLGVRTLGDSEFVIGICYWIPRPHLVDHLSCVPDLFCLSPGPRPPVSASLRLRVPRVPRRGIIPSPSPPSPCSRV